MEITRDVFILPPRKRRVPGVIWKLLKPVYGLADAPRGWYLALAQQMRVMGCENCVYDPAMYLNYNRSSTSGKKMIEGVRQVCFGDLWDEQCGLGLPQLRAVGTSDLAGL